jgi:hypothetical protein
MNAQYFIAADYTSLAVYDGTAFRGKTDREKDIRGRA